MSEQPDQPQTQPQDAEPEWPTHCAHCGTGLESGVVDVVPDTDSEHLQTGSPASVVAQDFCPNPECPGKGTDAAEEAGPGGSH